MSECVMCKQVAGWAVSILQASFDLCVDHYSEMQVWLGEGIAAKFRAQELECPFVTCRTDEARYGVPSTDDLIGGNG